MSAATEERTTWDKVKRLVLAATGDEYGDGVVVTNIIDGYTEPGYPDDPETVVVLGNWNPKRFPRDGEPPLTKDESRPVRLARALEKLPNVELEWLDEWDQCVDCNKALRTTSNSFNWKMFGALTDDGYVCAACLRKDMATSLEPYVNDTTSVTWAEPQHLTEEGWVQWEPDDEHTYETGWHPGQDDDPVKVTEHIRRRHGEDEVSIIFLLDESSMFYIRWSAWTKAVEPEESDG